MQCTLTLNICQEIIISYKLLTHNYLQKPLYYLSFGVVEWLFIAPFQPLELHLGLLHAKFGLLAANRSLTALFTFHEFRKYAVFGLLAVRLGFLPVGVASVAQRQEVIPALLICYILPTYRIAQESQARQPPQSS